MNRRSLLLLFTWTFFLGGTVFPQSLKIDSSLQVQREILDVRVLDVGGNPILGLTPNDFQLKIGGDLIPIEALIWVDPTDSALDKLHVGLGQEDDGFFDGAQPGSETTPSGRLITVFIQTELTGSRIASYLQMPKYMATFFDQLSENDYVAVYGFGSHLRLYCDFTRDRSVAVDAVQLAARRSEESAFLAANSPSLRPFFDEQKGRDIAKPEDALRSIAKNLANFSGNKTIVYLGYGFGRFSDGNVHMEPEYRKAVHELNKARVNVFSIDITRADYHPLEQGMRRLAEDTGGTYFSARVFPENAVRKVVNAISGYYRLSFQMPETIKERSNYRLELKNRKGRLYVRNPYNGAPELR